MAVKRVLGTKPELAFVVAHNVVPLRRGDRGGALRIQEHRETRECDRVEPPVAVEVAAVNPEFGRMLVKDPRSPVAPDPDHIAHLRGIGGAIRVEPDPQVVVAVLGILSG